MISLKRNIRKSISEAQSVLQWRDAFGADRSRDSPRVDQDSAMKISAFYRAIDIRSDGMGKFPACVKDLTTKQTVEGHYLNRVLKERPNEAMSPFVYRKLVEARRLVLGNSYVWILRDRDGRCVEKIPLPPGTCWPVRDSNGKLWYIAQNPSTGEQHRMDPADILHYKGFSWDGITGVSLLAYAGQVLATATARDAYEQAVYNNGGHPAGLLKTSTDLSSKPDLVLSNGTKISYKDRVRQEWDKVHSGAGNAFRVAVLDNGLEYQALSMSNSDAQFVENKSVTVEDIARFTGVPLNLLFTGKQSYNSNEANSLDYVKNTLQPSVIQYEQEDSFKLLTVSERERGLWIHRNMLAELRGDTASRAAWYKAMREIGAYSVNDILEKEDEPPVPGGDARLASLNYVPLESFEDLSIARNKPQAAATQTE